MTERSSSVSLEKLEFRITIDVGLSIELRIPWLIEVV